LRFAWPNTPEKNSIDTLVFNKLKKLRIAPSELCNDETFLRRVYLDIVGVLPTTEEYHRFMTSTAPNKRDLLVDELLGRKEFAELWVLKWAELLQIRSSQQVSYKAMLLYYEWLQQKIARNVPVNEWVQELLGASGGTFKNPATNFYQNETDILKVTENVAQVFMGMRIQCAQCHNHPFDRWTMDDYYGFAAFFSQIGYKNAQDPRELTVFNAGTGEMRHPVGDRPVKPKFLGDKAPDLKPGQDYRAALADWLTRPDNHAFARNFGNILWAHFFGRGIVEPVDDVRVSNPAGNPDLLATLGKKAVEYKFDVSKLARDICLSRTYQLSTRRNETNKWDDRNFARQTVRRMRAEVLLDCITQVTETSNTLPGLPLGGRAVEVPDGRTPNYFLATFGRSARTTACTCEVKVTPTLSQALHLLNGETTGGKIAEGKVVARLLQADPDAGGVAEQLYVRCLGRKPTATEREKIAARLASVPSEKKQQALEDLFWALLNTNEFLFNH
jgi:hypothetical protein